MMYSAAAKTSACSEMSGIVAAACCVYFLLLSFCSRPFVRVASRRTGFSHAPLWHIPSLKSSFEGTFVQQSEEGFLTSGKLKDTTVWTHLFVSKFKIYHHACLFFPFDLLLFMQLIRVSVGYFFNEKKMIQIRESYLPAFCIVKMSKLDFYISFPKCTQGSESISGYQPNLRWKKGLIVWAVGEMRTVAGGWGEVPLYWLWRIKTCFTEKITQLCCVD